MRHFLARLRREDEGGGMAEYALLIAGIAVVVLAAVFGLGGVIRDKFEEIGNGIEGTAVPVVSVVETPAGL